MFNALEYIRNLEAVGVGRDQAEVHVQLVLDAIGEELATKQDIADLKSEISGVRMGLKAEIIGVRTELKAEIAELRSELKAEIAGVRSELKAEISELRSELKVEIAGVRSELKTEIAEVRSDVASVKTNIAELKSDLLIKLGGTMVGSISVATCILGYLVTRH